MLIGTLAEKSGFSRDTIRYYEKRGLLESRTHRHRRDNNYREYSEQALHRLLCIRQLKEHGFTLSEIRAFLETQEPIDGCRGIPERLEEKLKQVDEQIAQLQTFRQRLSAALSRCEGASCAEAPDDQATVPSSS